MLLDRFVDHLTYEKRYSPHTVSAYRRDLLQFKEFITQFGLKEPEQATDRSVRAWMMVMMEAGTGARSVNRKLSTLRGFFKFARLTGVITAEPTALIDPPKTPQRLPEFVEEQRMGRMFDDVDWPEGYKGGLDKLVMELFYGTGMRLAELLGLRIKDLDTHTNTLRVLGKRNKERLIPLATPLVASINAHLRERTLLLGSPRSEDPLLVSSKGEPLARRSVQRLVTHYLSGVTSQLKRSPHVLRHTFATHMLEHGADLNAVKELLGHAGLAATQVYTHNTVEKLRKVHAQAHPRGGGKA
ncbi:MAG: tyrosine-type recombinase/integrase [Flavobacteriales bacterium]